MKTLVNWITFVWKCSFVNDIDIFCLFSHFLQHHRKIPLHFIGELYHPISPIFLMTNMFLIFCFIGKCFTTWGWRKIWIILFSPDDFLGGALVLVAVALVYLYDLETFMIFFYLVSFFWTIGWFESMYVFFYAGNIFDIYDNPYFWR